MVIDSIVREKELRRRPEWLSVVATRLVLPLHRGGNIVASGVGREYFAGRPAPLSASLERRFTDRFTGKMKVVARDDWTVQTFDGFSQ